jgi:hypothetical protein
MWYSWQMGFIGNYAVSPAGMLLSECYLITLTRRILRESVASSRVECYSQEFLRTKLFFGGVTLAFNTDSLYCATEVIGVCIFWRSSCVQQKVSSLLPSSRCSCGKVSRKKQYSSTRPFLKTTQTSLTIRASSEQPSHVKIRTNARTPSHASG